MYEFDRRLKLGELFLSKAQLAVYTEVLENLGKDEVIVDITLFKQKKERIENRLVTIQKRIEEIQTDLDEQTLH